MTTFTIILSEVAAEYGWDRERIKARPPSRHCPVIPARQAFMYRAKHETDRSLRQIGHVLGGLHHSTVLFGIERHAQRLGEVR